MEWDFISNLLMDASLFKLEYQHFWFLNFILSFTCKLSFLGIFNLLKSTGYVMHQQFNIQQFYVLPTLYLCVLYLSENKQRLVLLTA